MADPIQPQHHRILNSLAPAIDDVLNGPVLAGLPRTRKVGFALLVFDFNKVEGGRVNYISNATREDMVAAMKEFIARADGRAAEAPEGRQ